MQKTAEKVFFAVLCSEINMEAINYEFGNLITVEVLRAIYRLSKKHDLSHLVYAFLEKSDFLSNDLGTKKLFLQERNMAIYRYEQLQYEFEQICKVFEEAKIAFLPLKGAVLRDYYPEPWMRTSCDIDILVTEKDLTNAIGTLKRELLYEEGTRGAHDVNLFAPSGVHLELHFSLAETEDCWQNILDNVWEKKLDGWQYRFVMTNEMFYFYHIVHMAIHMRAGGCGVKPFLDLQILNRKLVFSRERIEELLNKGKLLDFEKEVVKLTNAWFGNGDFDKVSNTLHQYVLYGGVYGNLENRIVVEQVKKGGRCSYLLSRVFISYRELSVKYPSLKKRKVLFPFYQIYRWFDLLINKKSRNYTVATIKGTHNTTKEKLLTTDSLFQTLGL